jgi:hypothetical protein
MPQLWLTKYSGDDITEELRFAKKSRRGSDASSTITETSVQTAPPKLPKDSKASMGFKNCVKRHLMEYTGIKVQQSWSL